MEAFRSRSPKTLRQRSVSFELDIADTRGEVSRRGYRPEVPELLLNGKFKLVPGEKTTCVANADKIAAAFPSLYGMPAVSVVQDPAASPSTKPLRVGCVLSGGQAAGGHNCIIGLYDYLANHAPGSKLIGFVGGPKGVMTGEHRVIDREMADAYRNSGGFTMLASGRDKIETPPQFAMAVEQAKKLELDGLVVIGGDDSNTNAAVLAEHFASVGLRTRVLGLPKTIDGDLKNDDCETSFGFDTASRLYAELVGNIMIDCCSAAKYYHFIRLMGREASHLTLEVALNTRPTLAFIGEEVKRRSLTLSQIANEIVEVVLARAEAGVGFGVVLIPEGLIDFIPEVGELIAEINEILGKEEGASQDVVRAGLSPKAGAVFELLPPDIQKQLLLDRDPHGNVQVAKIESERLLGSIVATELAARKAAGSYAGRFSPQYHYFGYEGRCPPPTKFDCDYCYGLGLTAGALISSGCTGMMATLTGLCNAPSEWQVRGSPLTAMLCIERRKGKEKPVIRKALVELDGRPFEAFCKRREGWKLSRSFSQPGPVQYDGPTASARSSTILLERGGADLDEDPSPDTPLMIARRMYEPRLPKAFSGGPQMLGVHVGAVPRENTDSLFVSSCFPSVSGAKAPRLEITRDHGNGRDKQIHFNRNLTIGVVFCGRQCPGAHNVVYGLSRFLAAHVGSKGRLLGFVEGTRGFYAGNARELKEADIAPFVNAGGMHMLGRSADSLCRTPEQLELAEAACAKYGLDGLVFIGGAVSNSDGAVVAEHFASRGVRTRVVGVPASIDGDLQGRGIEASIGFDTACLTYASIIANLATDAASARKYWYFVRVMGRSPSHITLECAHQTQPNIALIGEELDAKKASLDSIVNSLADAIELRSSQQKNFGIVLIPEGLVEYIPEVRTLLKEVTEIWDKHGGKARDSLDIASLLTPWSQAVLEHLPPPIRKQMLLEPQESDNKVQHSQIEIERLLADLVAFELHKRVQKGAKETKFAPVCFYLGYQARSSMPSNFDCDLAYTLGHTAAALVAAGATGYLATAHCLTSDVSEWRACGVPLASLMSAETRAGQSIAAIRPSQVDMRGKSFQRHVRIRNELLLSDEFCNPGPLQMFGPLAGGVSRRLQEEHGERGKMLEAIRQICREVDDDAWPGCSDSLMRSAVASLQGLRTNLQVLDDSGL